MRKKTMIFEFNIWDVIDVEKLNNLVDDEVSKERKDFKPVEDISYVFKSISPCGKVVSEVNYSGE